MVVLKNTIRKKWGILILKKMSIIGQALVMQDSRPHHTPQRPPWPIPITTPLKDYTTPLKDHSHMTAHSPLTQNSMDLEPLRLVTTLSVCEPIIASIDHDPLYFQYKNNYSMYITMTTCVFAVKTQRRQHSKFDTY